MAIRNLAVRFSEKELPPVFLLGLILMVIAIFSWVLLLDLAKRKSNTQSVRIVTSLLPPYMDEAGRGREADIIEAALTEGYNDEGLAVSLQYFVQPFARHWMSFISDDRYDGVTTVPEALPLDGYVSDPYVTFQNGIGYRSSRWPKGFEKFTFDDLAGQHVVAFAGASEIISGLKEKRNKFSIYLEEADQRIHSKLLMEGQVDAVLADGAIFFEYNRRLMTAGNSFDASFSAVFCPTPYVMVFRKAEMRSRFNRGLKLIAQNGKLASINEKFFRDHIPQGAFTEHEECRR